MTLGFPGPFDAAKAASCDTRRIGPVLARGGMIAAQHPSSRRPGCACWPRVATRSMRRSRRRWWRPSSCRPLWHRRRSLRHRRPRGASGAAENGDSRLPRQRHRPARRLARVHARAWRGRPRRPPRDGPTGSALAFGPRIRRRLLRAARPLRARRSPSWPRRPSTMPPRGSRSPRPRPDIVDHAERLGRYPTSAAVFLPGGAPPGPANPAPARSGPHPRAHRRGGPDVFYRGEIAQEIAAFLAANGGALTAEDFADHETVVSPPLPRPTAATPSTRPGCRRRGSSCWKRSISASGSEAEGSRSAAAIHTRSRRSGSPSPTASPTPAIRTSSTPRWPSSSRRVGGGAVRHDRLPTRRRLTPG